MMLPPNCFNRGCRHYIGITGEEGNEASQYPYCIAFPNGIPEGIAYGNQLHMTPWPDQGNDIKFEKDE